MILSLSLSPMLITERTIAGYDIQNTHEKLVNLNPEERKKFREDLEIEYKYQMGMYIYRAMKKVRGNGCHGRPPVRVSPKDTWNICIGACIMTSHFDHFKSVLFEWYCQGIMGHWIAFIIYP